MPETFTDKSLTLELDDGASEVRLVWRGKSNDREPGRFLLPILQRALSAAAGKKLVLDFSSIEYMNSSTFTPLVKFLDEAQRKHAQVEVAYSQSRKWQALSFSALRAFSTQDGRISIQAR